MTTIYPKDGNVLTMRTMNDTIVLFKEVTSAQAIDEINLLIWSQGGLSIDSRYEEDKTSGKHVRQIAFTWKGDDSKARHQAIYEWLS